MAKAPQKSARNSVLENAVNAGKRLFVGAAQPFADVFTLHQEGGGDVWRGAQKRNKERGVEVPAAIEQVPASFYQLWNAASAMSGGKLPAANSPYLDRASERMFQDDDNMRKHIGIGDPKNIADVALEMAGSVIVPTPKHVPAAKVRMKPTTALGKAAEVAKEVPKAVGEAVIPFRQGTSFAKAAATQTALGGAVIEGIDSLVEAPEYKSIKDMIVGEQETVSVMDQPLEAFIPEELTAVYQESLTSGDWRSAEDILNIAAELQEQEAVREYLPEDPAWKDPVTTAAIFAGLGIGAYGIRRVIQNMAAAKLKPLDKLTGVGEQANIVPEGVKAWEANVQSDASLRWAGEQLYGKKTPEHDKFLAKLDSVTAAPLATKAQHAISTGELPNSTLTTPPLRSTLEAFATDVDDIEWQIVTDGLLARNALDDYNRTGTQAAFNDKTPQELEQIALRLETDPKLANYGNLVKQHYRDLLDYSLEQGLITAKQHQELITARPNYVHMSRNIADQGENSMLLSRTQPGIASEQARNKLFKRSEEERGGVQAGAAADPIAELPSQFSRIIRQAEVNKVKREFLELAANNAELSKVIKKIPQGETPKSSEGIHEVLVNGVPEYYKVTDRALQAALDFNPYAAKGMLSTVFGVPKRIAQTFITGAGNALFAATSATYDTLTGIALRPKGYDLGLLNEFKNKLLGSSALQQHPAVREGSEWVSRLDPSVWISAPIGAVRLAYDEIIGALAHDLSSRLLVSNDWFVQTVGPHRAQALQQRLAAAYDSSVKSLKDRTGTTTSNLLNPDDVVNLPRGMADIAPRFYARANARAYQEALEGNISVAKATLMTGKLGMDTARATSVARAYMNTIRLLHEGFRYQAFATNLPKVIGDAELEQLLASQTRRIAADIGQTGASRLYQEVASSVMYMNVGTQTLAQVGRAFTRDPQTAITNTTVALGSLMALQYYYASLSPENAAEVAALTDDEQTRMALTPVGPIPIPPELRIAWGPMTAITNEVVGINQGEMNKDFAQAFASWIEDDFSLGEVAGMSAWESVKNAVEATNPVGGGNPLITAGASMMGYDLGMSRFTGKPGLIEGQDLSMLGGQGKLIDDALSATAQKVLQDLLGTTVADTIRAGLDADRALSGRGGTIDDATRVALSRLQDNAVIGAGPLRGMIFGDYERAKSINDTEFKLYYKKKEGIEKAIATGRKDIMQQFVTGADPRFAMLRNVDVVDPQYAGTALAPITAIAAQLQKDTRELTMLMNEYKDQVDWTRNQRFSTIEERNKQVNEFNEKRKAIAQQLLNITTIYEDVVRQQIGDPSFTWQNFEPEAYANRPWSPQAPSQDNAQPPP